MIDLPPPPPESVIEQRLVDCGLDAGGFTVKYEAVLQSIEILIKPNAGATSDHFPCIAEAAGQEIVSFEDGEAYVAYTKFASELARPEMLVMLEARLKEAGLWDGFPQRQDFGTLDAYAEALEAHAGIRPRQALRISGENIVFDPPRDFSGSGEFAEQYSDLMVVIAFASTRGRRGFGFIGNEKAQ